MEDLVREVVGRLRVIMICFYNTCYLVTDFRKLYWGTQICPFFLYMLTGSQRGGKFAKFIKILQKSGACLFHTSLELYLVNRFIAEKPSLVSFIIHSPHFY